MKINTFLAEGFEETEAIAVIDLLRRANFNVNIVSITEKTEVNGGHNIKVIADSTISKTNLNDADAIFLPGGGLGVENLSKNQKVLDIVKNFAQDGKYIIAICAAPAVLEKAGVIANKKVTSFPGMKEKLPSIASYLEDSVVIDGKIITSRGIGTAIDLGLKIVEIFKGKDESEKLRKGVVYKI